MRAAKQVLLPIPTRQRLYEVKQPPVSSGLFCSRRKTCVFALTVITVRDRLVQLKRSMETGVCGRGMIFGPRSSTDVRTCFFLAPFPFLVVFAVVACSVRLGVKARQRSGDREQASTVGDVRAGGSACK